jgi:transposase-like protein
MPGESVNRRGVSPQMLPHRSLSVMEEEIKRWTARRKAALVLEIIQGNTTVAEASRSFDLPPSEIEEWVDEGKRAMENALRSKPLEIREEYERQLKELQEAYGEAMLELRARKKLQSLRGEDDK